MYVPKPRAFAVDQSDLPPEAAETAPPALTLWKAGERMEDPASSGADIQAARVRTLIVDDDAMVRETFVSILRKEGYETHSVASGAEALELLARQPFDIMLCDIVMPGQSGMELLSQIVTAYPDMPVILVTGHASVDMARDALHLGASDFITKPCKAGDLPIIVERNLTRQAVQRKNALRYRMALQTSNESILDALLSALDTRDTETQGHSERVTAYTMEMADLMGLPSEQVYHIERGALLHDIGKIGIPDRILLKPGKLTSREWIEMRKHPVIGYQMCARIEMLKQAAEIVLHHHEAWDGSGYPDGLAGEAIPLGARIFAIADTLDAITSDRPYHAAMPFRVAREEIVQYSGRQFDPEIVKVFLDVPEARWQLMRRLADK